MKLRIFRLFICFLLVCCLLVRISPIQAKAVGFTPALYALDASNIIVAGARALGIGPGDDPLAFNTLITDAKESLFSGVTPLVNVWLDYVNGGFRAFLSADFLSRLLSFLFDSSAVSKTSYVSSSHTFTIGTKYVDYTLTTTTPTVLVAFVSDGPYIGSSRFDVYLVGSEQFVTQPLNKVSSLQNGYEYLKVNGFIANSSPISGVKVMSGSLSDYTLDDLMSDSYSASPGLVLDSVSDSLSGSAYSDWTAGAITQEDQPYVPVSIPSLSDSTAISTQTQAQAQAGTVPDSVADEIIAGADVVPETGTIADVITAVRALGADMVAAIQAVPAAIADVFTPSQTIEAYSLDLKSLFPFCIPFDIYAMLSALSAEPVAPKFDFELDFGPVGVIPISADFSEWDNVAQLLRTCEAALFAVGLAVKTKDLIGW